MMIPQQKRPPKRMLGSFAIIIAITMSCGGGDSTTPISPECNADEDCPSENRCEQATCIPSPQDSAPATGELESICGESEHLPCSEGLICDFSDSACGSPGICITEEILICSQQRDPVCGCDGQTYNNDCQRKTARVGLASNGPCPGDISTQNTGPEDTTSDNSCTTQAENQCPDDYVCDFSDNSTCEQSGTCVLDETLFCTQQYEPVCGCDGVTYSNSCFRQTAHQALAHEGACEDSTR